MKNKIVAVFLAFVMAFCMLSTSLELVLAEGDTIEINSMEDFLNFSKKCTLDTYSVNKTVNLNCDIDFSKTEFSPIGSFGGTFYGNGHTISQIADDGKGSYRGLFRYVTETGKICDLTIKGDFAPGGSKSYIGSIAGENSGVIQNCIFEGSVKGENSIGGIAGINTDTGEIKGCVTKGNVTGEYFTGGIAGKNTGFIQNCTNYASVNTVYEEKSASITGIETDIGSIVENYKNKKEENENSMLEHSDTGGIAGYNTGIIQGAVNNASIGYEHIGYNVGGIAGRQSGYILGCENHGAVKGRKDVGGIVGQAEPYVLLNASESLLGDLRDELNKLNSMVNIFITDAEDLGDNAKAHLDEISKYAKDAQKDSETLVNIGTDFVDDNIDQINAEAAILSDTIDKLTPVFEKLESAGGDLGGALDNLVDSLEALDLYAPDLSYEIDSITYALKKIAKSEKSVSTAVEKAEKAKKELKNAITFKDEEKAEKALNNLSEALGAIIEAKSEIRESMDAIREVLEKKPESFEEVGLNAKAIAEELLNIGKGKITEIASLVTIKKSIDTILINGEVDFVAFKSATGNMATALDYLLDAFEYITEGIGDLGGALSSFTYGLTDYIDSISENLTDVKEKITNATNELKYATEDITDALGDVKNILEDLSNEDTLEFVKLGDDFREASESLFDSLGGISDELDKFGDVLSDGGDKVSKDIRDISNQFNLVMNLMLDEFDRLRNSSREIDEIFVDVSDENIESTKQGKVENCRNFAVVEADRNAGGIAGAIAIEYSKDPEDEIEKPDTLNFTYKSKAILYACMNEGKVTGKKDCTGGVVGLSEIGTVYKCENYGDCESTGGNYTGGIAGKSESSIRKCYAKSKVTGQRYVGGIAGKGDVVSASYAIVNVTGDENYGAVLGDAKNKMNVYRNFFTDNGVGAIDNISYCGKAEPIEFDALKEIEGIPARFVSFSVTFVADGEVVETQSVRYGSDTGRIKYPKTPEKEGHYGSWEKIEAEYITENVTVSCIYNPYITILASEEKNESGKMAMALCEGEFTSEARLHIKDGVAKPPVGEGENVKVYDVNILNANISDSTMVKVRILNEKYDKVTCWSLKKGKWEKIKTESKGKYVVCTLEGASNTVCVKYDKNISFVWIILIVVIIVVVVIVILKRRKGKKGVVGEPEKEKKLMQQKVRI